MPLIPMLLVEDEPSLREALTEYFGVCGFAVTAVGTAAAALDPALPSPQILLTDLSLPDRRGDILAQEFHRLHPDCRLYIYSGDSTFIPSPPLVSCGLTRQHVFAKPGDLAEMVARFHTDLNPAS